MPPGNPIAKPAPGMHFRMIELQVTPEQSSVTKLTFPDQPDVRYARILGLEVYTASDITNTFPSGYAMLPDANLKNCSLVLETNDSDITNDDNLAGTAGRFTSTQQNFQYMPFATVHNIQNGANPMMWWPRYFPNTYITWQKSFVAVTPGGLGNSGIIGIAIGIWYTWIDINGKAINRT